MKCPWNEEQKAEWEKWLQERPDVVASLARKFPPYQCLIMKGRGHYIPISYQEGMDDKVTMTLAHGDDSFLPGVSVFGIPESDVKICGCGEWEFPTPGRTEATKKILDAKKREFNTAKSKKGASNA